MPMIMTMAETTPTRQTSTSDCIAALASSLMVLPKHLSVEMGLKPDVLMNSVAEAQLTSAKTAKTITNEFILTVEGN